MQISLYTTVEIFHLLEKTPESDINFILNVFNLDYHLKAFKNKIYKEEKTLIILKELKDETSISPFGNSFRWDLLQYLIDRYYRFEDDPRYKANPILPDPAKSIPYEDKFSVVNPALVEP